MPQTKPEQIKEALQLIDPVLWVVTSKDENGHGGLIATFVSNISIVKDCPRFLIGIAKHHHTWTLIENSGCCALHLFSKQSVNEVQRLGTCSGKQIDKLAGFQITHWATGAPILSDAVAAFDCKVESRFDSGDRTVYLLEVVEGHQLGTEPAMQFSDLWEHADLEQKNLMKNQLAAHGQIDQLAIEQFRQQNSI
ncbi:MAG: flavin reductase family protein, partial [Planctomycetaceae bacterium]|nr:flavin reductase family protein [Planctomycetaceae bacterium]